MEKEKNRMSPAFGDSKVKGQFSCCSLVLLSSTMTHHQMKQQQNSWRSESQMHQGWQSRLFSPPWQVLQVQQRYQLKGMRAQHGEQRRGAGEKPSSQYISQRWDFSSRIQSPKNQADLWRSCSKTQWNFYVKQVGAMGAAWIFPLGAKHSFSLQCWLLIAHCSLCLHGSCIQFTLLPLPQANTFHLSQGGSTEATFLQWGTTLKSHSNSWASPVSGEFLCQSLKAFLTKTPSQQTRFHKSLASKRNTNKMAPGNLAEDEATLS